MKAIWIILIIVVIILAIGYSQVKKAINNFSLGTPKFVGADLKSIFTNGGFAAVDLTSTITNNNKFSIPVSNLYIEVYYQGALVGKSTTVHNNFTIPANGTITISQNMTLAFNNTIDVGLKIISGQQVTFTYIVKATIFNLVPLRISNSFTY